MLIADHVYSEVEHTFLKQLQIFSSAFTPCYSPSLHINHHHTIVSSHKQKTPFLSTSHPPSLHIIQLNVNLFHSDRLKDHPCVRLHVLGVCIL